MLIPLIALLAVQHQTLCQMAGPSAPRYPLPVTLSSQDQTHQTPKTFEDLEIEKLKAYHGLKTFHEVLDLKVDSGQPNETPVVLKRETFMDGDRFHVIENADAAGRIEALFDGKIHYLIYHPNKTLTKTLDDGKPFDFKANLLTAGFHVFNMNVNSGMPFQIAADPQPQIQSIETVTEGKKDFRKVVAITSSTRGNQIRITEWFLPDRWILDHATVREETRDSPMSADLTVKTLEFDATPDPKEFVFDQATLKGYKQVNPQ
jgi:hypothetical protein